MSSRDEYIGTVASTLLSASKGDNHDLAHLITDVIYTVADMLILTQDQETGLDLVDHVKEDLGLGLAALKQEIAEQEPEQEEKKSATLLDEFSIPELTEVLGYLQEGPDVFDGPNAQRFFDLTERFAQFLERTGREQDASELRHALELNKLFAQVADLFNRPAAGNA